MMETERAKLGRFKTQTPAQPHHCELKAGYVTLLGLSFPICKRGMGERVGGNDEVLSALEYIILII